MRLRSIITLEFYILPPRPSRLTSSDIVAYGFDYKVADIIVDPQHDGALILLLYTGLNRLEEWDPRRHLIMEWTLAVCSSVLVCGSGVCGSVREWAGECGSERECAQQKLGDQSGASVNLPSLRHPSSPYALKHLPADARNGSQVGCHDSICFPNWFLGEAFLG